MKIYSVKVIGERKPKPKRAWWFIAVEAENEDEAKRIAVAHAEAIAPSDTLWAGFYAAEWSTVRFPLELKAQLT